MLAEQQKKPTYAFLPRTPPPFRKLPLWHTFYFMRIYDQTQTCRTPFCGTVYQWYTVV